MSKLQTIQYNGKQYAKVPVKELTATINSDYFETVINRVLQYGDVAQVALKLKALQNITVSNALAIKLPFGAKLGTQNVFFYVEGNLWPSTDVQHNWGYIDANNYLRVICSKDNYLHIYFSFIKN